LPNYLSFCITQLNGLILMGIGLLFRTKEHLVSTSLLGYEMSLDDKHVVLDDKSIYWTINSQFWSINCPIDR
jgi:hypothetical protein